MEYGDSDEHDDDNVDDDDGGKSVEDSCPTTGEASLPVSLGVDEVNQGNGPSAGSVDAKRGERDGGNARTLL